MAQQPKSTASPDTIRLSERGLPMLLGDLQARVLRAAWELGHAASARQIHERVIKQHQVELLTVITVLNKLVTKGVLIRAKQEDVFHYTARHKEEEFMASASRRVVEGVLSLGHKAVAASLVDVLAERDPEQLAELGRLIRRRLSESEGK
ncbi:MAG TPA: BlaI/MecI/CopY family transcriptional regulator [Gemmatimonadaceae bacterium]|nr:BlaI/MecI/CopY family transcriptional regulator [Gemmatimonadaceae bacterium]